MEQGGIASGARRARNYTGEILLVSVKSGLPLNAHKLKLAGAVSFGRRISDRRVEAVASASRRTGMIIRRGRK